MKSLRLAVTLAFFELETAAYLLVNRLSSKLPSLPLLTPADEAILMRPRALWLYLSFVPYCLIASSDFGRAGNALRIFACVFANSLVAYRSFLRTPSSYPRPRVETPHEPHLQRAFDALHAVDRPSNTFPSIHVSHTVLLALLLSQRLPPKLAQAYLSWACGISLSTLLTKQHYLVDVTAGVIVAERLARSAFEPRRGRRLVPAAVAAEVRELCRELDAMVQPGEQYAVEPAPLVYEERHPAIQAWLREYVRAGSFSELYKVLSEDGQLEERKRALDVVLARISGPLRIANRLMPGWLQFVQDFQQVSPELDFAAVYGYLRDLDAELHSLLELVFQLPEPEAAVSVAAPAGCPIRVADV